MTAKRYVDIFETYDRFNTGERVSEEDWDYGIIPKTSREMKERYDIDFDGVIIPEDQDMIDRLFVAGVDMLLTCGFYNSDTKRVMKISEDELYEGLKMAPKYLTLGSGKDAVVCNARRGNHTRKPVIQGGPTGAPVSEEIYTKMIESYVQEPTVDTIVTGLLNTVNGHKVHSNSPWELRATMEEIRYTREAMVSCGRPGMGI